MQSQDFIFRQEIKKIMFPKIYEIENLPVDKNLVPVELTLTLADKISSLKKVKISFELKIKYSTADVFLYLNGQKIDMYYSIPSGSYTFNFYPKKGNNIIEIFYLVDDCKSPSVFSSFASK
jgi:hypothetical protein